MKHFTSLIICLLLFTFVGNVYSDQIIIFGKDRSLLLRLQELEKSVEIDKEDTEKVIIALDSKIDDIRTQSIRVILAHRLTKLWSRYKDKFNKGVGTSKKLSQIVDKVFAHENELNKPIIQIYSQDLKDTLSIKSDPENSKIKGGDVPLEDVLLDIAVIDAIKRDKSEDNRTAKELLNKYKLNSVHKKMLNNKIKIFKISEGN